jgi:hypothetical protein
MQQPTDAAMDLASFRRNVTTSVRPAFRARAHFR